MTKRTGPGIAPLLRALVLAGTLGCGGEQETSGIGNVTVLIAADKALPIEKIEYEIKGRGGSGLTGSVRVNDLTRTLAANVRGLPAGRGYEVSLSAVSTDSDLTCSGRSGFEIKPDETTTVTARLGCRSRSGTTSDGAAREYCPLVRSITVAPTQTSIGGTVTIRVDAVAPASDPITFAWSGPGGSFGEVNAATTTFTCMLAGDHLLTLRIVAGLCLDRALVTVRCADQPCGNGNIDPGETCDDGNRRDGDACPADCRLPGCGNGKLDPGEACDPPGTATCDHQCRKPSGCGNGVIDPGEECDDGNRDGGDGCSLDCRVEALCGNGLVEPGEDCEPPGVGNCSVLCKSGSQ